MDFINALYANHVNGSFDAVNIHPYTFSLPEPLPSDPSIYNAWSLLPQIYQTMVAGGDGAKKVWYTEYGCPTGTTGGYPAYSDAQQAAEYTSAFEVANSLPYSGPLFSYDWIDNVDDFGLYDSQAILSQQ